MAGAKCHLETLSFKKECNRRQPGRQPGLRLFILEVFADVMGHGLQAGSRSSCSGRSLLGPYDQYTCVLKFRKNLAKSRRVLSIKSV